MIEQAKDSMRKVDGSYSLSMLWSALIIILTVIYILGSELSPDLEKMVSPETYAWLVIVIKAVDIFLRKITILPMLNDWIKK